jgi:hypothetical protein
MLPDEYIKLYLNAIDHELTQETNILRVHVHAGYRATIERYLENRNMLDLTELMQILSLYSIEGIPEVEQRVYQSLEIVFVPHVSISLIGIEPTIKIDFVPQAMVSLSGIATRYELFVPQVSVSITGVSARISYAPQAHVQFILPVNITNIPQASISFEGQTPKVVTEYAPQMHVTFTYNSVPQMEYVPQLSFTLEAQMPTGDDFLWGFTPYGTSLTRASYVSYMQDPTVLSKMLNTTNYAADGYLQKANVPDWLTFVMTEWDKNIPVGETAYMVFLIPVKYSAKRWANPIGTGIIGGALNEDTTGNHWPDPDGIVTYNGKSYNLYIGNRRRRNSGTTNITI